MAAERKLMEVTGLSRSQIRARLAAFGQANQNLQLEARIRTQQQQPEVEPTRVRDANVRSRGFNDNGNQQKGGPAPSSTHQIWVAVEDGSTEMRVGLLDVFGGGIVFPDF